MLFLANIKVVNVDDEGHTVVVDLDTSVYVVAVGDIAVFDVTDGEVADDDVVDIAVVVVVDDADVCSFSRKEAANVS